jgi:hypothetical protein
MLPAKLFAVLAVVLSICAWLVPLGYLRWFEFSIHDNLYFAGSRMWLLYGVVIAANFAILYYAPARCWHIAWQRTLSVLHFSLFALAAVLFFGSVGLVASTDIATERAFRGVAIAGFLGLLSFILSWIVFAVNLVWTAVRTLRTRYAAH